MIINTCVAVRRSYFHARQILPKFRLPFRVMEKSKAKPVSNSLVFSSLFLTVVCFAGLIHVEIELHAHRQMLQVLNQPKEEKLELKNLANDEKPTEMNFLYPYQYEGGFKLKKISRSSIPVQRRIYL